MKAYLLALGFGLLVAGGSATAADLYQPQPAPQPAPMGPVTQASGWYLRGDVSYDFNKVRGLHFDADSGSSGTVELTDLDDSANVGLGIGYRFNKYLRADVTGDYMFRADFHGVTHSFGCAGGLCTVEEDSGVSLLSLLANAYVDLGTYHGVTPYIGAGIGATHVDWKGFDESSDCADCVTNPDGKDNWRFTYALMAGASVDLTCNLKFDAGYRYRHIDGDAAFDDGFSHGRDDGFNIHEVRGGLRYVIGGCSQPAPTFASYEPAAPIYK